MAKHLIREDEHGLYVLTGGYAFRPAAVIVEHFPELEPQKALDLIEASPRTRFGEHLRQRAVEELEQQVAEIRLAALLPTALVAGLKVSASHRGGTQLASVSGETWASSSDDPQYQKYVAKHSIEGSQ